MCLVNPADISSILAAGVSSTPPADLAELSLAIFGMRIYPTSHQTAGFALLGPWRACSTLVIGMDPTYYVDPYSGLKTNKITTLLEEAGRNRRARAASIISVDLVV